MQSSMDLAGIQWNMPVLSYFISVLMKSKSLAWSSAMPTSSLPDMTLSAVLACGLKVREISIHILHERISDTTFRDTLNNHPSYA